MRMNPKTVVLAAVMTVLTGTETLAALSGSALVDATTSRYRHWSTVYATPVPLRLIWPPNATQARLDIQGMNSAFTTNLTTAVSNWLWQAFNPDGAAEDVYDLTLTFLGAGETVIETQTARLAVVAGAVGGAAIDAVNGSASWAKVKKNVVIPFDAAWEPAATNDLSATLAITKEGGPSQTNALSDAAGYCGWKLINGGWGYGAFHLSLSFPSAPEPLAATLTRPIDGMMFKVK